ncbi:MAG TPA: metalloregulator ArsR/SmtB family transcription factor [Acidimicrobiia bacterium]|nr:metalloregulator ArsR/SmtB family transcription factor [Acidimicrobiia bacterium]
MTPDNTLHDLSSVRSRRVTVDLEVSPVYDLLLTIWSTFGGDDKSREHSLGKKWFEEFRTKLSDETQQMAVAASAYGELWVALIPLIAGIPGEHSIDAVLRWLDAADPVALRADLLSEKLWDLDPAVREAAARGDAGAIAAVLAHGRSRDFSEDWCERVTRFLEVPADRLLPQISDVLRRVRAEGFAGLEEEWGGALERDAAAKEQILASTPSPRELIETFTNGISYELPPGIRRLILVPSVSLRPWTVITDRNDSLVVCYPVSEEALVCDPQAPPSWLLAVYRALGDEKRMRLLRRLAESPATLPELTEHLGMAKSTVFHHMGVLRAAGLVRVQLGADHVSTYSLRLESLPDIRALLDEYLSPSTDSQSQGAQTQGVQR